MDVPDASVDRVVALECAFHFSTREEFFREAFRVLRRGGAIATADLLARPGRHALGARLFAAGAQAFFQVPRENQVPLTRPDHWFSAAVPASPRGRARRGELLTSVD
jgi:ubiquinone/menaquinone biosynthesis C-methylase UbiE